ncbi:MAG: nucleoside monophosphate kinase [Acidobacteria bacterium]|nr:nucleoside monophosphate kinase [Acidobacteriota bacterium]
MKIVILGAPGAGKGTQARNLAGHLQIAHIATGDVLREHIRRGTEIGEQIAHLLEVGALVPDDIVIPLVQEALGKSDGKFILDGFPRTLAQARSLAGLTDLDYVIKIDVVDAVIVERMSGRLTCSGCGEMFHTTYRPPAVAGKCDVCSRKLTQRNDDKAKTVRHRLKLYHGLTNPIEDFYREKGLFFVIPGIGGIADITGRILKIL